MTSASHWRSVLAEVEQARLCSNPVRLHGIRLDRTTGELADADLLVPCKDRRAAVCPSCSRLYQADAWQLVAAGIRGGKGVDTSVVEHPQLFVTLTAPSFGPVHRASADGGSGSPCRPRRKGGLCFHARPLSCTERHDDDSPLVGDPLCTECFDYRGAVLWNAHVSRLWARTCHRLYREVARAGRTTSAELRTSVRLSYLKVVEFQARGLVHLHVVVRADGGAGPAERPPAWLDAELLGGCIEAAVARARVAVPEVEGTTVRWATWGSEHDVRVLVPDADGDATAIASYVAKYSTKTADGTAWLAHPVRTGAQIERLGLRSHVVALVRTAWTMGGRKQLAALRLREHAHTLGYPGQFSSKSVRYSTTFAALRRARVDYVEAERETYGEHFDYDAGWRYAGRGYSDPGADDLARSLLDARPRGSRRGSEGSPTGSPTPSPDCPQGSELGEERQEKFRWGRSREPFEEPGEEPSVARWAP